MDLMYQKAHNYKGEFEEYARPFDRYLDETRFKELKEKEREREAR
jgi:hypothetical protein